MAPASGRLVGVTNPSTRPASTNHGIVPSTISAPRRAPKPSATRRLRRPGSISAQPTENPAAPLTAITDSSSTPWGATSDRNGPGRPAATVKPPQPDGGRVAGPPPPGQGEVARPRPVDRAEPADTGRPEPFGPAPGALHQPPELLPLRRALADEGIEVHIRRHGRGSSAV